MGAASGSIDVCPVRRGPYADGVGRYNGWAITSYFGGRVDPITGRPGSHGGEDIAHGLCFGEPIIAPVGGLLSQGWDGSGGGNWSGITGHNGDYWGFGHASRFAWPGGGSRWVNPGDVIAFVGSTGASTGAHLHIAYRPAGAGSYRDPFDALATYQAQAAAEATAEVAAETIETIKEVAMARHIKNIDGHQIYVTPELNTFVVTDQGRRALLELDLVEKLPNGDEWDESTDVVLNTFRPIIASGQTKPFGAP